MTFPRVLAAGHHPGHRSSPVAIKTGPRVPSPANGPIPGRAGGLPQASAALRTGLRTRPVPLRPAGVLLDLRPGPAVPSPTAPAETGQGPPFRVPGRRGLRPSGHSPVRRSAPRPGPALVPRCGRDLPPGRLPRIALRRRPEAGRPAPVCGPHPVDPVHPEAVPALDVHPGTVSDSGILRTRAGEPRRTCKRERATLAVARSRFRLIVTPGNPSQPRYAATLNTGA